MLTDIGEYLVGAYLQIVERCDFVQYNVRPPHGGLEGLNELDVVGFNFASKTVYLCEVTTHICGLVYVNKVKTVERIKSKHERQKDYAEKYLTNFDKRIFQFWSPIVRSRYVKDELSKLSDLDLVIDEEYTRRVELLRGKAKIETHDARNPVFRLLQILEHLRPIKDRRAQKGMSSQDSTP